MIEDQWTAVDNYINRMLVPMDDALQAALQSSAAAGLPTIQVSAAQGKWLHLMALACQARQILEIGTLGGYSTIWLARAVPSGGRVVSLEIDPKYAAIARENIARAGLAALVEVQVGKALDLLPQLAAQKRGPFDLIFIDADKANCAPYFEWALKLSRVGSIIVIDNVVRSGAIVDAANMDASVQGVRRLYEAVAAEPRVCATAIQTVGGKGYDGFALARVMSE